MLVSNDNILYKMILEEEEEEKKLPPSTKVAKFNIFNKPFQNCKKHSSYEIPVQRSRREFVGGVINWDTRDRFQGGCVGGWGCRKYPRAKFPFAQKKGRCIPRTQIFWNSNFCPGINFRMEAADRRRKEIFILFLLLL
ncbi:hypothetical protein CEXT_309571 [Caerostris extrusa]|uniref:Uncharacterized protein n=1 Tax=Caerostris extrusa TaxID=172846 RepID=A0AAV4NGG9_CAEEX|nr:hypothetical protein CEXT_309571 [Caerostris extrusa]